MAREPNPAPRCSICGAKPNQASAHKCQASDFVVGKIEQLNGPGVLKGYKPPMYTYTKTYPVKAVQLLREALVEIKARAEGAYCGGSGACAADSFNAIEEIAKKALEATKD